MQTVTVDLGDRSYPIRIAEGVIGNKTVTSALLSHEEIVVVTNDTVAPLYLETLESSIDAVKYSHVILPDGEQHKNLATLESIFDHLLENRYSRHVRLVALGGGVIGDITGFAAACYQRGVSFIQVPTTLLAQVDSSVGGKTGVNHRLGKNMIGAFHQPAAVLVDTSVLATLPDREYSAGMAEVIKYGLIRDREFYQWLQEHAAALSARNSEELSWAIRRCCEIKASVVREDEKESGVRAILNLGHTFGHAIENCAGYGQWLHGEAVAAGMVMALDMSVRSGYVDEGELATLCNLLGAFALPVAPPKLDAAKFLAAMKVDKKNQGGRIRLVLLESIGQAVVTSDYNDSLLEEIIQHYL